VPISIACTSVLPHGLSQSFPQAPAEPGGKRNAAGITEQCHNIAKTDVMRAAITAKTEVRIDLRANFRVEITVEIGRQIPAGLFAESSLCRRWGELGHRN
jgi:hypothetical protein